MNSWALYYNTVLEHIQGLQGLYIWTHVAWLLHWDSLKVLVLNESGSISGKQD